jgi:hypothetical protein
MLAKSKHLPSQVCSSQCLGAQAPPFPSFEQGALTTGNKLERHVVPGCAQELTLLQGKHTSEFAALLGYHTDGELIHRGNLALLLAGEVPDGSTACTMRPAATACTVQPRGRAAVCTAVFRSQRLRSHDAELRRQSLSELHRNLEKGQGTVYLAHVCCRKGLCWFETQNNDPIQLFNPTGCCQTMQGSWTPVMRSP